MTRSAAPNTLLEGLRRQGIAYSPRPGRERQWDSMCPTCNGDLVVTVVGEDVTARCRGKECAEELVLADLGVPRMWSEPPVSSLAPRDVELGELLEALARFIRRYVVVSEPQTVALALWIAHTHAFSAAEATPYISITSAEKESGKTRALEVTELVVARPWLTGRVTAAVLSRKVDAETPTLLLDESDAAFNGEKEYAEALRGILNTGHRRGGNSTVCVSQGGSISYKDFSTFCPKAIAGIGKLPDTVESRSVHIRLKRRAADERVERFRRREANVAAEPLRWKLEAWGANAHALVDARPDLPDALGDRAQDCWEPLLAIADLADGGWPKQARAAAIELSGRAGVEDESIGVRLLADIREVLHGDRISSINLLEALAAIDESPWGDWYGKPLTSRTLAKLLRPYEIRSRSVRFDDHTTCKGFMREQFEDAFSRHLPQKPAQRHDTDPDAIEAVSDSDTEQDVCRDRNGDDPASDAACAVVPGRSPGSGAGRTAAWTPEAADAFIAQAKRAFPDSREVPA